MAGRLASDLIINDGAVAIAADLFIRGDADGNGTLNLIDAISILAALFAGGTIACEDANDIDDSGTLTLIDPVDLLGYLFAGLSPPLDPFARCGLDPTDDALDCVSAVSCP